MRTLQELDPEKIAKLVCRFCRHIPKLDSERMALRKDL